MPKITVSKESLEGGAQIPPGVVEVRCDGFDPKLSKKLDSVNLRPKLKIINSQTHNDRQVFENLNSKAGFQAIEFFHALGLELEGSDKTEYPLEYFGDDAKPETWNITSPAIGRTARVELGETEYQGKKQTAIKRYFCRVSGCTYRHKENLL